MGTDFSLGLDPGKVWTFVVTYSDDTKIASYKVGAYAKEAVV